MGVGGRAVLHAWGVGVGVGGRAVLHAWGVGVGVEGRAVLHAWGMGDGVGVGIGSVSRAARKKSGSACVCRLVAWCTE